MAVLSASTISMSPPVRLTSSLLRRAPHGRSFARNTRSSFCSCGGDAHFFYRHSRASRRCPLINRLDGIYLYDIDDLQSVASFHLDERGKEVELAEAMIAAEVEQYQRRLQAFNVVPEIVHLQRSLEEIRQAEHRRLQSQLQSLSPEQAAAVEMLTQFGEQAAASSIAGYQDRSQGREHRGGGCHSPGLRPASDRQIRCPRTSVCTSGLCRARPRDGNGGIPHRQHHHLKRPHRSVEHHPGMSGPVGRGRRQPKPKPLLLPRPRFVCRSAGFLLLSPHTASISRLGE